MKIRKRWYALLLLVVIVILFARSEWLFRWMYPIHYADIISKEAADHNVDPYLVAAIIQVESKYKPDRQSSKGAVGLMQIMPDTAKWAADLKRMEGNVLDKLDQPEVNIDIGAWYIASLMKQFDNNATAAIAAYNGGPGNVKSWLSEAVWNGSLDDSKQIPFGETRHFVRRVHYFWNKYHEVYDDELYTKTGPS